MTPSYKLREFIGYDRGARMLNAMAYHSPIKTKVCFEVRPRKDIGQGKEAMVHTTYFDLDGAISYYKARLADSRYNHLAKYTKQYIDELSELKEWLKDK